MTAKITESQLHILRHSLGIDDAGNGRPYRNHYCAGPDTDVWPDLMQLCELGLMENRGEQSMWGGASGFTLTDAGRTLVMDLRPAQPRLTRSQKRYRQCLKEDCGEGFGEWLRRQKWRRLQTY